MQKLIWIFGFLDFWKVDKRTTKRIAFLENTHTRVRVHTHKHTLKHTHTRARAQKHKKQKMHK